MTGMIKIVAGIVLYNPDLDRLFENVSTIYDQVDMLVLINNGSTNYNEVLNLFDNYEHIHFIDKHVNEGIASALSEILLYAKTNNYDWALTLDQDSVCKEGLIYEYKSFITSYSDIDNVGIITCNIIDRNFQIPSSFDADVKYIEIRQAITSGQLIQVSKYERTDGFDKKLFIDSVDFDLCINMRLHGYKIIRINFDGLIHEVGKGKNVSLLGKEYITYNHPPFRQYYIARNHLYLARKYPSEISQIKEAIREIRAQILIMIFEDNKINKLAARWKGIKDIRKM